ncbi:MAG: hypothetical protein JNK79_15280 [Chitinophagaceae bacterium]|nr:hypothetical protein [Chitinophagaceae bacterium]
MQLTEVTDERLARRFLLVNVTINKHDPNYIRPLDKDINGVFDASKNKALRHAEITRWILEDSDGNLLGRIAAFVNRKYKTKGDEFPVGGIGFFDCINNQEAADMLFNVAKHWLMQRGMGAMDGPINCGERDRWWGVLVEGFTPPPYCMNYNQPYYKDLFENYGFRKFFNQYCFALSVKNRLQDKFYERHDAIAKNPAVSARHLRKNQIEKFAVDFATVYNKAWAGHGGLKEVKKDAVVKMFRQMRPVMDEKLVWFVYEKDEPIAIWVNLPDLNQWFKYLDGKFNFWAKLKFLWVKKTKKCSKFTGIVFGIVPQWQGSGVDSYMIVEGAKVIQGQNLYDDYEMQWIGDFNPKMINIAKSLGTYVSRKLITYRYLFDQTKEFKEHPVF